MGGIPTNILFKDKFICIGENHTGEYSFDFDNKEHYKSLLNYIVKNDFKVDLWYEGVGTPSKSFTNFKTELTKKIPGLNIKQKSWEEGMPLPNREDTIAGVVLGAEVPTYKKLIGQELNGNQTLLEAIVKSSRNWKVSQLGSRSAMTEIEIKKALSDGTRPSDVLLEMQKPNSASMQTLNKLYAGGQNAMRAKYFKDGSGALKSSEIYARVARFNDHRDLFLVSKIKQNGGIFLMGDGHVTEVKKLIGTGR